MMRKFLVVVAVVVLLAVVSTPTGAQTGGCCKNMATGQVVKQLLPTCEELGPDWVKVADSECAPAEPTPVPTPWEPGKTKEVPGWLLWLIGIFANKFTLPIAFGALVISVVAGLRQLVALFGGKLGEKATYLVAGFMAFATAAADAVADGVIAGQEWVILLTTLATFVAAIFGYRLLFSANARARLGK